MPTVTENVETPRLYCNECVTRIYIGETFLLYGSHIVCYGCYERLPDQVYETEKPKPKVDIED